MRWIAVSLFLVLMGCAPTLPPQAPSASLSDGVGTEGILTLVGRYGRLAHACPIAPDRVVTSAHVLDVLPFDPKQPLIPYRFSTALGDEGLLLPLFVLRDSDLGVARVIPPVRVFYPPASKAPEPGTKVRFVQFKNTPGHHLARETKEAKVLHVVAGCLELSEQPKSGASGSCVLNESGELVAVLSYGAPGSGIGMGVWGAWRGALTEKESEP